MKPRFSLRTLFVVMTLIAALFGWRKHNVLRAESMAQQISSGDYLLQWPVVERDGKYSIDHSPRFLPAADLVKTSDVYHILREAGVVKGKRWDSLQRSQEVMSVVCQSRNWLEWLLPSLKVTVKCIGPVKVSNSHQLIRVGNQVSIEVPQTIWGFKFSTSDE